MQELIKLSYNLAKFGDHGHSGSEDIMVLVGHVIPQDHMIQVQETLLVKAFMENHHSIKFGGHRYCGNGDMNPENLKQISKA